MSWKIFKKTLASWIIVLLTFNPFVPTLVMAEELAVLETGSAESIAISVSETNTTAIESQLDTSVVIVTTDTASTLAPFPADSVVPEPSLIPSPSPSFAPDPSPTPLPIPPETEYLSIDNQATSETTSQATATTGDNSQEVPGDGELATGDAAAIATSLSLTNTTLVDSTLQVGVIMILDEWFGDIVIDPPSSGQMASQNTNSEYGSIEVNNNHASVTTIATASATTGNNTQTSGGNQTMTTGDASAISQANSIVNTTMVNADIFTLLTENIWLWSGNILNWESPGSVTSPSSITNMSTQNGVGCSGTCSTNIDVDNQANVTTTAIATASTGGNTQSGGGDASMTTGNAYAAAVATSVVNTTLINSRYRQLSLLLFAPWIGNLVFAYPDIEISATAPKEVFEGDELSYQVTIHNHGYGKATKVEYGSLASKQGGNIYTESESWEVMIPDESIVRTFRIPTGGLAGQEITLESTAITATTEESATNNITVVRTNILSRPSSTENKENIPAEVPILRLSSTNNINNFVFPGDGVTYDMVVYNDGPIGAKNIILIQDFYSPDGTLINQFLGNIGDLALNQRKSIRFVMQTGKALTQGEYYTNSQVIGESDSGAKTDSNIVRNGIMLQLKQIAKEVIEAKVQALDVDQIHSDGKVLGTTQRPTCRECLSFPWYIAITLGSIFYYLVISRQRDFARALRYGLTLPLASYAGLILSNPNCANGIVMLPGSGGACQWFLPISFGIYLFTMTGIQMIKKTRLQIIEDIITS